MSAASATRVGDADPSTCTSGCDQLSSRQSQVRTKAKQMERFQCMCACAGRRYSSRHTQLEHRSAGRAGSPADAAAGSQQKHWRVRRGAELDIKRLEVAVSSERLRRVVLGTLVALRHGRSMDVFGKSWSVISQLALIGALLNGGCSRDTPHGQYFAVAYSDASEAVCSTAWPT